MRAEEIEAELRAAGTPERAEQERPYLKSDLEHFGVTVFTVRRIALAASAGYSAPPRASVPTSCSPGFSPVRPAPPG